jgi:hypothetical protein
VTAIITEKGIISPKSLKNIKPITNRKKPPPLTSRGRK